jgi:hypothetical protein
MTISVQQTTLALPGSADAFLPRINPSASGAEIHVNVNAGGAPQKACNCGETQIKAPPRREETDQTNPRLAKPSSSWNGLSTRPI